MRMLDHFIGHRRPIVVVTEEEEERVHLHTVCVVTVDVPYPSLQSQLFDIILYIILCMSNVVHLCCKSNCSCIYQ